MIWLHSSIALSDELKVLVQKQDTVQEDSKALIIGIPNKVTTTPWNNVDVIASNALKYGKTFESLSLSEFVNCAVLLFGFLL